MSTLTDHIDQIVHLSADEKKIIEKYFVSIILTKGDLWIKQGKICDQVAYIASGKLRTFYIDDEGNEVTCFFVTPDNFISSFTSFLTNTPSKENISALEKTEIRVISKKELEKLSISIPKLQIFRRVIAENLFITLEKRISMLQSMTAYERYEILLKENPDILLNVPLQYTASFLGITPQHLSRLRKDATK
jgi:CRP-like cAMP-binding protein